MISSDGLAPQSASWFMEPGQGWRYFEAERLIRHGVTSDVSGRAIRAIRAICSWLYKPLSKIWENFARSVKYTHGKTFPVKSLFFGLNHFELVSGKAMFSAICTSFTVLAIRIAEQNGVHKIA